LNKFQRTFLLDMFIMLC